jgi:hypothetical protein
MSADYASQRALHVPERKPLRAGFERDNQPQLTRAEHALNSTTSTHGHDEGWFRLVFDRCIDCWFSSGNRALLCRLEKSIICGVMLFAETATFDFIAFCRRTTYHGTGPKRKYV